MCAAAAGTLACHLPAYWALHVRRRWCRWRCGRDDRRCPAPGDGRDGGGVRAGDVGRGAHQHRSMVEAFRLRFENQALLDRLSATQGRLEETNRTLEQRVAERTAELERQGEALRHAQRMETVGRLAGGIAHDFNNLLTVVLANVGLHAARDDAGRQLAHGGRGGAGRGRSAGANLVRQLLAFSRRQRLAPRVIDLNSAGEASMDRLLTRLVGETIEMQLELAPGGAPVKADASQLEQVLVNLVTNARDAMPARRHADHRHHAGGRRGRSHVWRPAGTSCCRWPTRAWAWTTRPGGWRSNRSSRPRTWGEGTGLGLATVYGIVEQSGGRVSVDSRPGEGSRFEIYLPRTVGTARAMTSRDRARRSAGGGGHNLAGRGRARGAGGHRAHAEAGGLQGHRRRRRRRRRWPWRRAHRGHIDLLISDVVMPKLGGAALARQLSAERPGLRVLFVSGYSWEGDLPTGDHAGHDRFPAEAGRSRSIHEEGRGAGRGHPVRRGAGSARPRTARPEVARASRSGGSHA